MTTEYRKPLPVPINRTFTQPFWDAAKQHQLVMPRCKACDLLFFYPREACPRCLSDKVDWVSVSGRGRVHTFTVIHQPAHPSFNDEVPYAFAIIQLDEGPRMPTRLIDCAPEDVQIDMPVVAHFDDVTPDVTLVKFRPA